MRSTRAVQSGLEGYFRDPLFIRMPEHRILIPETRDRSLLYDALVPQVHELLRDEPDPVAAMANMAAALRETFGWHWIGFYRALGDELVLGPFQGPVACGRIPFGKGVCGKAWAENRILTVDDVDQFPGHIACSALSRSEIVVPIHGRSGSVAAVLDIDSSALADFSEVDAHHLQQLSALIAPLLG